MADVNFIEFYASLSEALTERTSPQINLYEVRGIQLLPNNPLPYIQTTNVNGGIELEDWTVSIVRCDDKPVTIKGSQNLLLYSNDFSNVNWEKIETSISGEKLISSVSGEVEHKIRQIINKDTSLKTYTLSVVGKSDEYHILSLFARESTSSGSIGFAYSYFDLDAGTTFGNGGAFNGFQFIRREISSLGDGYYRCSITFTTNNTTTVVCDIGMTNGISSSYIGDGVSGIFIKNSQIQEGTLSSYLETTDEILSTPDVTTLGTDITDYFTIEEIFTDENGYSQFTWSLKNVPFDFGNRMVYLKANNTIGETFYSNMFQLTENSSEKTTRIDYKSYNKDTMQSIQLKMWYWQPKKNQEISLYYERSTKNTVENTVKSQKYELWLTEVMSSSLFMKISDILEYKYKYFNLVRAMLFENIDPKEHTGRRNSERYQLKLSFNSSDVYDPLAAEISTVNPLVPEINLVSVITSANTAYYYFNFANFTPTYFILEYSDDQVNWTTATQVYDTASPKAILFDEVGTWYFRMRHPEAVSNIFTLELGETVIANDDTLTIAKGGVSEIDVLFNDSLVGDTTIISVSTATNGIVEIIESGTKIRYTHDDSSSVSDSFTYTISNGITSDTATVEMTIVPLGIVGMWFVGASTKPNACSLYVDEFVDFYYSGGGVVPTIDSVIYSITSEGYTPFNGHGLWYQITGAKVIRIDENGVVTGKSIC